jgi:hypothetical protein
MAQRRKYDSLLGRGVKTEDAVAELKQQIRK